MNRLSSGQISTEIIGDTIRWPDVEVQSASVVFRDGDRGVKCALPPRSVLRSTRLMSQLDALDFALKVFFVRFRTDYRSVVLHDKVGILGEVSR